MGKAENSQNKIIYLEALRIIAIFFVIFNHTGMHGFILYVQRPIGSISFWIYMFISIFCKLSVPLFFMISGSLMLGRKSEFIREVFKKRILKILIVLLGVSLFYYCFDLIQNKEIFDFKYFVKTVYSSNIRTHLWFLYFYIAYLIILPFLQVTVKVMENRHYYYLMGLALFFGGILPVAEFLLFDGQLSMNGNLKVSWILNMTVLYPCIGFFLKKNADKIEKKHLLISWGMNILGVIVSCWMTYLKGNLIGDFWSTEIQTFYQSFVLLNCICMYVTVAYVFSHIHVSEMMVKIICRMGSCTFGVYLIHVFFLEQVFKYNVVSKITGTGMNAMIAILLICLGVMGISYLLVMVMKRIPILKEYI